MSSNPQTDPHAQKTDAQHSAQDGDSAQSFSPEELRKAARAQMILYIVMAVFIVLPFIVMWLRGAGSEATVQQNSDVQQQTGATAQQTGGVEAIVIERGEVSP